MYMWIFVYIGYIVIIELVVFLFIDIVLYECFLILMCVVM